MFYTRQHVSGNDLQLIPQPIRAHRAMHRRGHLSLTHIARLEQLTLHRQHPLTTTQSGGDHLGRGEVSTGGELVAQAKEQIDSLMRAVVAMNELQQVSIQVQDITREVRELVKRGHIGAEDLWVVTVSAHVAHGAGPTHGARVTYASYL